MTSASWAAVVCSYLGCRTIQCCCETLTFKYVLYRRRASHNAQFSFGVSVERLLTDH